MRWGLLLPTQKILRQAASLHLPTGRHGAWDHLLSLRMLNRNLVLALSP